MNFNKLSLEEKFGQMILLGLDVYDINEEIIKIIQEYKIGGVILYKKNYTSLESMTEFIYKLNKINEKNKIPLFIAIDQENGRVNRLPKEIVAIHNALAQSNTNDMNLINSVNEITSYILKKVGINMNFAPVLDIVRSNKNKVIGNRSYGNNYNDVVKYAIPFMKQLQKDGIISVVKHFPGHGLTINDSHFILPKIKNLEMLEKEDLKVFEEAIKNGADAIMCGHLLLKGYGITPASLNKKIINDFLLKKTNYKGILMTDDLRMKSLKILGNIRKNVKNSILAGNNIVMIKFKKGDKKKLYEKLLKDVKNYDIDPKLINDSAKKIIKLKIDYKIGNNIDNNKVNISINNLNKKIKNINGYIEKNQKYNI